MNFYLVVLDIKMSLMNKRTPVPGYRLLSSPSTKLKLKDIHYETPCITSALLGGRCWSSKMLSEVGVSFKMLKLLMLDRGCLIK